MDHLAVKLRGELIGGLATGEVDSTFLAGFLSASKTTYGPAQVIGLRGPGQVTGDEVLKKQEDNESFENKYLLEKTEYLSLFEVVWRQGSMCLRCCRSVAKLCPVLYTSNGLTVHQASPVPHHLLSFLLLLQVHIH